MHHQYGEEGPSPSFVPCWNHTKTTSVNICVSELFANIQFVFVGCWVSSSGTHSYLFPTQKGPLPQKKLFGVFFCKKNCCLYFHLYIALFCVSVLVGFVAIVSKADNYISLSSSIHILSISSQPFHLFFYLFMPLLSILTSLTDHC